MEQLAFIAKAEIVLTVGDLDRVFADDLGVAGSLVGPEVNLHVIRPLTEFSIDTLTFDPALMSALVREGSARAVAALDNSGEWLA